PTGGLEGCALCPLPIPGVPRRCCAACSRENGVSIAQIAMCFGVHEMTLHKWIRQAGVEAGGRSTTTRMNAAEMRDLKRRVRLLEQENEVLRRAATYLSQANLPGKGSSRS